MNGDFFIGQGPSKGHLSGKLSFSLAYEIGRSPQVLDRSDQRKKTEARTGRNCTERWLGAFTRLARPRSTQTLRRFERTNAAERSAGGQFFLPETANLLTRWFEYPLQHQRRHGCGDGRANTKRPGQKGCNRRHEGLIAYFERLT